MAAANSSSRLGLTLQQYDQVIALSQANINASLEYHFDTNPDLCNFEATINPASTKDSVRGKLKPPRIELIDEDGADRAFYCLEFEKRRASDPKEPKIPSYTFWKLDTPVADPDPDAPPPTATWKKTNIDITGWKLAFYVNFGMKAMASVPDEIRSKIQLAGSYSVEQLLIDFGTAETMTFSWDRSRITGFEKDVDVKSTMTLFVTKWLEKIKTSPGNHNCLGYAIKVDKEAAAKLPNPEFPPTSVRLQTIAYWPDGDKNKASPSNDNNAFLFTEMTQGRSMPSKDLAHSGDWFYESIGGTLAMSRGLFWQFLKDRLSPLNQQAVMNLNTMARTLAGSDLTNKVDRGWFLADVDGPKYSLDWNSAADLSESWEWNKHKYHEVKTDIYEYEYWVDSRVKHRLSPNIGYNSFTFEYDVYFSAKINRISLAGFSKLGAHVTCTGTASSKNTIKIEFKTVDKTGGLGVTATDSGNKPVVTADGEGKGIFGGLLDMFVDFDSLKAELAKELEKNASDISGQTDTIEKALNDQGRFVFPGGGTFDMKDPIFNNAGDLLVGLSYRQGEAAKAGA